MNTERCTILESDLLSIQQEIATVSAGWEEPTGNLQGDLQNEALVQPAVAALQSGGKRVRPLLCLWAFRNLAKDFSRPIFSQAAAACTSTHAKSGVPPVEFGFGQCALRVGVATEVLHAGSLIIDDIQDGSLTRRGAPTVHRKVGVAMAINIGNWMYFKAMELLREQDLHADAVSLMSRCHFGQSLDLVTSRPEIAKHVLRHAAQDLAELYSRIARNKTAELMTFGVLSVLKVSFQVPQGELMTQYASLLERYGLLFQKVDDLQNLSTSLSADKAKEDLSGMRNIVVIQMLSSMNSIERAEFLSQLFQEHSALYVASHPLFLPALQQTVSQLHAEIATANQEAQLICSSIESEVYFKKTIHDPLVRLVKQVEEEFMHSKKLHEACHLKPHTFGIEGDTTNPFTHAAHLSAMNSPEREVE